MLALTVITALAVAAFFLYEYRSAIVEWWKAHRFKIDQYIDELEEDIAEWEKKYGDKD